MQAFRSFVIFTKLNSEMRNFYLVGFRLSLYIDNLFTDHPLPREGESVGLR